MQVPVVMNMSLLVFEVSKCSERYQKVSKEVSKGSEKSHLVLRDRFLGITGKFASHNCYEYVFVGLVKSQNVLKDIKRFLKRSQNILES